MKIVEGHQNRVTGALIIDTLVVEIMEKCGATAVQSTFLQPCMQAKFLLDMLH